MSDITAGQAGPIKYDISWEAGKVVLSADASDGALDAALVLKLDAKLLMDALIAKAPAGLIRSLLETAEAAALGAVKA